MQSWNKISKVFSIPCWVAMVEFFKDQSLIMLNIQKEGFNRKLSNTDIIYIQIFSILLFVAVVAAGCPEVGYRMGVRACVRAAASALSGSCLRVAQGRRVSSG